ncbi:MAG: glutamate racemase [Acidimicrobiia bacterium]|nr:glutamate racemase [Acidimicrobiia bacterium]
MGCVGIFDSGVGGLSVLAEFRRLAPGHPVVYLADQAWTPYGERSLDEVRSRAVAITEYLVGRGCELIVVACNSASAAALHHLREVFPSVPFVGMEPAVKPAASRSERGVIGVLATEATFQGELYASVVDRHANGAEVIEQPCPGLADAIERLGIEDPETLDLTAKYVAPLRAAGVDTIVLGCTHYPFLLEEIQQAAGAGVAVIDPAPAVARQTLRLLDEEEGGGDTTYLTTGDPAGFRRQIHSLLRLAVDTTHVELGIGAPARIDVVVGDLTEQNVDAIVNAANVGLQHGGGVAAAIVRAGGKVIQAESAAWVAEHGPLQVGSAAVTSAGALPSRHVIHVAGPIYSTGQDNAGMLRAAVAAALRTGGEIGARSIALPAISAGIYGYPVAEATAIIADEVVTWTGRHPGVLDEVRLLALDGVVAGHFARGLGAAID